MAGQVFISYSRKDDAAMQRVVSYLRKQGINVWVDNEKLTPGTSTWKKAVEKAIKESAAVVVFLSPDAYNSTWVEREISFAESHDIRIFPVLIRGNEKDAIPITLVNHQRIDLRLNEEFGLNVLRTALSSYLGEFQSREKKVGKPAQKVQPGKENHVVLEKPAYNQIKPKITKETKPEEETDEEFEFYNSPIWWIISILVIFLSVGGAFLANWIVGSIANSIHIELPPNKIFLFVLAGIVWGIIYVVVGLFDEYEERSQWSSIFGILLPYSLVFDPFDFGEFIFGLLSAPPVNIFLAIVFASAAAQAANFYLDWSYYSIYNIVFGFISIVSLGRSLTVLSDY
jgi:hypothetical protein